MFNCAVKIISWFLLVVDSLAPKCPNQTEKLKTRMLSISHQDKMLAITSKVDICTKVAHHVHVVYLIATFHIRRWRGMMVTILKANKAAKWPTGDRVDTTGCSLRHPETFPSIFIASTLGTREVRPSKQVF